MNAGQGGALTWRTSTRSMGNGDCVEVAATTGWVLVRDSKDTGGPVLPFTPEAWRGFLGEAGRDHRR